MMISGNSYPDDEKDVLCIATRRDFQAGQSTALLWFCLKEVNDAIGK